MSGLSLDTRILMREYGANHRVRLAMDMFSFRVLKDVSACFGILGGVDAAIFGGGIAENTPLVRKRVCDGLRWCGLEMDDHQNDTFIDLEGRLSTQSSRIQAWVILAEENLQIAHECCQALYPPVGNSQQSDPPSTSPASSSGDLRAALCIYAWHDTETEVRRISLVLPQER